jgi:hypothetical protein
MRLALLAGLASLFVAQAAKAEEPEPEEPIELGLPPPPPPGAETALEPDGPVPQATKPADPDLPTAPERPPQAGPAVKADVLPEQRDLGVPKRQTAEGWYGWQAFIGDGAALFLVAVLPPNAELFYGGGAYLVTAPAIHLGHKRGLAALGSFALRLGVPYAAATLDDSNPTCNDGCVKTSMLVSAIAVSILDGVWIANDRGPSPPKRAVSVAPAISVTRKAVTLSLGAVF